MELELADEDELVPYVTFPFLIPVSLVILWISFNLIYRQLQNRRLLLPATTIRCAGYAHGINGEN
jgi:hypothetical protein